MERKVENTEGISIVELFTVMVGRWFYLLKFSVAGAMVGLFVAFTSPVEWVASTQLIPETSGGIAISGSLSSLAGLAGVDIGSNTESINPELYPNIASSTPFLISLMEKKYHFSNEGKELSVKEYFEDYSRSSAIGFLFGLPGKLLKWFRRNLGA